MTSFWAMHGLEAKESLQTYIVLGIYGPPGQQVHSHDHGVGRDSSDPLYRVIPPKIPNPLLEMLF